MRLRSIIAGSLHPSRLYAALAWGAVASWVGREWLTSLVLPGRSFVGRSWPVQAAVLVLWGAVLAILLAGVFSVAEAMQGRLNGLLRAAVQVVLSLLAVLALTALWNGLLQHNWRRIESLCLEPGAAGKTEIQVDQADWNRNCLYQSTLGGDPVDYWFIYRGFPKSMREAASIGSAGELIGRVGGDFSRRPLYAPLSAALGVALYEIAGLEFPVSMFMILAFYASLCSVLLFHLLSRTGLSLTSSALLTGSVTISFGWLSVLSIPESYALGTVGALVGMLSGYALLRATSSRLWPRALWHALVTAVTAWLYPPNSGALFFPLGRTPRSRQLFLMLAASAGLVAILVALPQLYYYGGFGTQLQFAKGWGDLHNLGKPAIWLQALAGVFLFSVISPLHDFLPSRGGVDWAAFFSRPGAVVAAACLCVLYILLVVRVIRLGAKRELYGPALWLLLLVVWQVYWDPAQVLLFGAVPLAVLAFIVGSVLRDVESVEGRKPLVVAVLSVTLVALLALNWPAVFG